MCLVSIMKECTFYPLPLSLKSHNNLLCIVLILKHSAIFTFISAFILLYTTQCSALLLFWYSLYMTFLVCIIFFIWCVIHGLSWGCIVILWHGMYSLAIVRILWVHNSVAWLVSSGRISSKGKSPIAVLSPSTSASLYFHISFLYGFSLVIFREHTQ